MDRGISWNRKSILVHFVVTCIASSTAVALIQIKANPHPEPQLVERFTQACVMPKAFIIVAALRSHQCCGPAVASFSLISCLNSPLEPPEHQETTPTTFGLNQTSWRRVLAQNLRLLSFLLW